MTYIYVYTLINLCKVAYTRMRPLRAMTRLYALVCLVQCKGQHHHIYRNRFCGFTMFFEMHEFGHPERFRFMRFCKMGVPRPSSTPQKLLFLSQLLSDLLLLMYFEGQGTLRIHSLRLRSGPREAILDIQTKPHQGRPII